MVEMEKIKDKVFVKNSSSDINYGSYWPEIRFRTDGGRLYLDKTYMATLKVDEKQNKIIITLKEGS